MLDRLLTKAARGLSLIVIAGLAQGALAQAAADPPQWAAGARTISGILDLLQRTRPDPAQAKAYREILDKPLPPDSALWFTKRNALLERMDAAEWLGDLAVRLQSAQAIMAIFRARNDGLREMEFGISYAGILRESGLHREAYEMEEAVAASRWTYPHWLASYHFNRTQSFALRGDVQTARSHHAAAATEFFRLPGNVTTPNYASGYYFATATLRRAEGRYADAEANYLLAMEQSARWLAQMGSLAGAARHALPSTRGYSAYVGHRLAYASMLRDLGRMAEAERVALQPLVWSLQRVGKYSPHAVRATSAYAELMSAQGRPIEAEQLARAALEIASGLGADSRSLFTRSAQEALARALLAQDRAAEADELFEQAVDPGAGLPALQALAAVLNGRAEQVLPALQEAAALRSANLGEDNPLTGEVRGVHAMALLALARTNGSAAQLQAARAEFQAALPALLAARRQVGESEDALRVKLRNWVLQSYLELLADAAPTDPGAAARAFELADLLRGSETQQAVAASAARAGANNPELAAAVRREQDLRIELTGLYRTQHEIVGLSTEALRERGIDPSVLRQRISELGLQHGRLFTEIEGRFPRYANLLAPKPPTLAQAQASLQPGEALLSVLSTQRRTLVWALTRDRAAFATSALGEAQIAGLVKRLRDSLDVGDRLLKDWPEVDLAASHALYKAVVAPVQAALDGAQSLIVAADASLAALPHAVLTTAEHTLGGDKHLLFDRYAAVPWLGLRYATAQVPSVNAWVSLRGAPPASENRTSFIGFGDPVFARTQLPAVAKSAAAVRVSTVANASTTRKNAMARPDAQSLRSGRAPAWIPYSHLAPLPETRDEVLAIAKVLGADPERDVVLGADVTRQRVMRTDLSRTRVVAFATHGLLPGDFPGLTQPALALSAPAGVDADAQPLQALLTLEDVLQLKLDADWVVLSACNTASSDGLGGQAVSGLGRGFFYAGSRSMLVTHWSVETDSAMVLVAQIFSNFAAPSGLSRAIALKRAMQSVRETVVRNAQGQPVYSWAHPMFWAPYALVGEAGR